MEIQCECGKFRAELTKFPQNTPGRLKCYCDDCQTYLYFLKREDLLDDNGGTEIVPAYPADIQILAGKELIKCTRLSPKGMFRFSTTCCNTPIVNTDAKRPWAGIPGPMYTRKNPNQLSQALGPIKSSIMGKFGKGTLPPGTPATFDFKGMLTVLPFILKGQFFGKSKSSPFFENGNPIATPKILSLDERKAARHRAGFLD